MTNSEEKLKKLLAFGKVMNRVRATFPELAKEIDRCVFDVRHNNVPDCADPKCYCKLSFEQFHEDQNAHYQKSRKQNYEFN